MRKRAKPKGHPSEQQKQAKAQTSKNLLDSLKRNRENPNYSKFQSIRESLPACKKKESILEAVKKHQVTLISGISILPLYVAYIPQAKRAVVKLLKWVN